MGSSTFQSGGTDSQNVERYEIKPRSNYHLLLGHLCLPIDINDFFLDSYSPDSSSWGTTISKLAFKINSILKKVFKYYYF